MITDVIRTMPKNGENHLPRRSFAQAVSAFSEKNLIATRWNTEMSKIPLKIFLSVRKFFVPLHRSKILSA